ncbi:hypothetical protein DTO195F2_444 [Paecilomyces variotii]|nr:hypothetical protein DTO195F2_444 [Paecilomyces variotii]KAJ9368538.1 hypothetical protein DTO282E5_6775 [Paecilomyces variotii]
MEETVPIPVWSTVRIIILQIPPYRLFLFPFMAGAVWFLTLSALLITWLARGAPRYPGQGNPYIAFISDIASFELKPLFLVGTSITAVCFIVSVAAVHVVRYEYFPPPIYPPNNNTNNPPTTNNRTHEEDDDDEEADLSGTNLTKSRAVISLVSLVSAIIAAMGLILLGVMDTFRYHQAHSVLLKICFAALALTAAGTVVVYAEEVVSFLARWEGDEEDKRTRKWLRFCTLASAFLVILEFGLGIIEWVMAFLGTGYMGLFAGFFVGLSSFATSIQEETRKHTVRQPGRGRESMDYNVEDMDERERMPLLSEGRLEWTGLSH